MKMLIWAVSRHAQFRRAGTDGGSHGSKPKRINCYCVSKMSAPVSFTVNVQ